MSMRFVFLIIVTFMIVAGGQRAQAGFQTENIEAFVPTSAWLVGPATLLSDTGMAMPCVMMNQYNTGYIVRFSGGGKRIFATAIDFRQDIFTKSKSYDVEIGVLPGFENTVSGVAHNDSTLLIDTKDQSGFYSALVNGKYLFLAIDGVQLSFALPGVKDGLQRVEECYDPVKPSAESKLYVSNKKSLNPEPEQVPPVYAGKVVPEANVEDVLTPEPRAEVPDGAAKSVASEKAVQAGSKIESQMAQLDSMMDRVSKVLASLEPAAGEARQKSVGMTQRELRQPQPVQVQQQQNATPQAVPSQPIGKPLANTWLQPAVQTEGPKQHVVAAVDNEKFPADDVYAADRKRRWRAIRGTNLREVLDVWARTANVRLLWKSGREFTINDSMRMQGTFEEAVTAIFEQHINEKHRPVGRIYIDPGLGQKVLLVEDL